MRLCDSDVTGGSRAWRCHVTRVAARATPAARSTRDRASRGSVWWCRPSTRPRNLREVLPTLPARARGDPCRRRLGRRHARDRHGGASRPHQLSQMRRGKGNALAAGFAQVTGDVVVDVRRRRLRRPAEIPAFVEALVEGADFAKGSRFRPGGGSADPTVGPPSRQPVPAHLDERLLPHPVHRPRLRLQRLLGRPDPAVGPARPRAGHAGWCADALGRRLRDRDTHQLPLRRRPGWPSPRSPASSASGIHGESNLHAVSDGLRVLRTLRTERARVRREHGPRPGPAGPIAPGALGLSGTMACVTRVGMIATRASPRSAASSRTWPRWPGGSSRAATTWSCSPPTAAGSCPSGSRWTATRSAGSAPTRPAGTGTSARGCSGQRCARGTTWSMSRASTPWCRRWP